MTMAVYFDMDGTIADLYGVDEWLSMLREGSTVPYEQAAPMVDMDDFNAIIDRLVCVGFTVGVISWSAMNGSKEYNKAVRKVKREWIKKYCPALLQEFHVVKYGTSKHRVAKIKDSILVDDNKEVREAWTNGNTISAYRKKTMMKQLNKLVA